MRIVTFVHVPLKNRPGQMEAVVKPLAEHNVSIRGLATDPKGVLLLTTDPARTVRVLEHAGHAPEPRQALDLGIADKRGQLARVLAALAEKDVNVEGAFGVAGADGGHLYLWVQDIPTATAALAEVAPLLA